MNDLENQETFLMKKLKFFNITDSNQIDNEDKIQLINLLKKKVEISLFDFDIDGHIKSLGFRANNENIERFYFPNLEVLSIYNGNLLDKGFINEHRKLKDLSLVKCNLKVIPDLYKLYDLLILKLNDNQISKIDGLDGLSELKKLSLANNIIHDIEGLKNQNNLEILTLTSNQIEKLSRLSNLSNLRRLYLNKNKIQDLNEFKDLLTLENLSFIDLSDNMIKNLNITQDIPNLTEIYLNNNKIGHIAAVKNLSHVEIIKLKNNEITKFENFSNLPNLNRISIDNNPINSITGLENLNKPFSIGTIARKNFDDKALENLLKYFQELNLKVEKEGLGVIDEILFVYGE